VELVIIVLKKLNLNFNQKPFELDFENHKINKNNAVMNDYIWLNQIKNRSNPVRTKMYQIKLQDLYYKFLGAVAAGLIVICSGRRNKCLSL